MRLRWALWALSAGGLIGWVLADGLLTRASQPTESEGRALHPDRSEVRAAPQPWVAGCRLVRAGRICETQEGDELSIWVRAEAEQQHRISVGGQSLAPRLSEVVEGGYRHVVRVSGFGRMSITTSEGSLPFELEVTQHHPLPKIEKAKRLRRAGQVEKALRLARQAHSGNAEAKNRAKALMARIALAQGDGSALQDLERISAESFRLGRVSDAIGDAFAIAYSYGYDTRFQDLGRAREVLARTSAWVEDNAWARAGYSYYSGVSAARLGYLEQAHVDLRRAIRDARRIGDLRRARHARVQLAQTSAALGLLDDAVQRLLQALESPNAPNCERGAMHVDLGWIGLQAAEQGRPIEGLDVRYHLDRALYLNRDCGKPMVERNDRENLALWDVLSGNWGGAREWVRKLSSTTQGRSPSWSLCEQEVQGRIALGVGKLEQALEHFERLGKLAQSTHSTLDLARSHVWAGDALASINRFDEALDHYAQADAIGLEDPGVPADGGVFGAALGYRDWAARRRVALLAETSRSEEAFSQAVAAYTRSLGVASAKTRPEALTGHARSEWEQLISEYRSLRSSAFSEDTDDWKRSDKDRQLSLGRQRALFEEAAERLRRAQQLLGQPTFALNPGMQLQEGEIVVVLFPGRDTWWALWQTRTETHAERLGTPVTRPLPPAAVEAWLELARADLLRAKTLSVVPYARASELDVAALLLDGQPLAQSVSVRVRLGLGRSPGTARAPARLIIGDPLGDLPQARREALWVSHRLGPSHTLLGAEATHAAVVEGLSGATLVHYAGHTKPGPDAWFPGLELAAGARLSPTDVLTLSRAPERVVLAACDAGRTSRHGVGGGSLAHAFVLAGSNEVVAPVRVIDDVQAGRFQRLLYASFSGQEKTLTEALAKARIRAIAEGVKGWESYRVFVP